MVPIEMKTREKMWVQPHQIKKQKGGAEPYLLIIINEPLILLYKRSGKKPIILQKLLALLRGSI
jgi:hypothetical protein